MVTDGFIRGQIYVPRDVVPLTQALPFFVKSTVKLRGKILKLFFCKARCCLIQQRAIRLLKRIELEKAILAAGVERFASVEVKVLTTVNHFRQLGTRVLCRNGKLLCDLGSNAIYAKFRTNRKAIR